MEEQLNTQNDVGNNTENNTEDRNAIVYGRNEVRELLSSDKDIDKIYINAGNREGSIIALIGKARARKIPIIEVEKSFLDELSEHNKHQGIIAQVAAKNYCDISDILAYAESKGEKPFIVIADKIEDPFNLGAIIRSAECAGVHGIIIPKRHCSPLTSTVVKASAGAIEHMLIAKTANITAAIEYLKKQGLWIYATDVGASAYYDTDFSGPAAVVLGSEGNGISRLVAEHCDFTVSIPLYGKINSLNVSAAAAVVLCEAAHQRHKK